MLLCSLAYPRINRQSVRMNLEQVRHRRPQTGRSSMHSTYLTEIENSSVLFYFIPPLTHDVSVSKLYLLWSSAKRSPCALGAF